MIGELVAGDVALTLCPIGACPGLSFDGEPCEECVALFAEQPGGWRLERTEAVQWTPTPEQAAATARIEREHAIATGQEKKPNQLCWLCEERRSCTRTAQGWECDACLTVQ